MGYIRDNGKDNGNYYLGFRAYIQRSRKSPSICVIMFSRHNPVVKKHHLETAPCSVVLSLWQGFEAV